MIYCNSCAERHKLPTDSYFGIGLAQCEICGGGQAPYFRKWVGIDRICEIALERNHKRILSTDQVVALLNRKLKDYEREFLIPPKPTTIKAARLNDKIVLCKLLKAIIASGRLRRFS